MKFTARVSLAIYKALGKEEHYYFQDIEIGMGFGTLRHIESIRLPAWWYYHLIHKPLYMKLYKWNGGNVW